MCLKDIWSILQHVHFMFLIDIDLISKTFKISSGGSSGLVGARFSKTLKMSDFIHFDICKNVFWKWPKDAHCFCCFVYPGVSKDKKN